MGESRRSQRPWVRGAGEGLCLELGGWPIVERLVQADVVEPTDVLDDRELELRARLPGAIGDQVGLRAVDEALGQRVVIGVAVTPAPTRPPSASPARSASAPATSCEP